MSEKTDRRSPYIGVEVEHQIRPPSWCLESMLVIDSVEPDGMWSPVALLDEIEQYGPDVARLVASYLAERIALAAKSTTNDPERYVSLATLDEQVQAVARWYTRRDAVVEHQSMRVNPLTAGPEMKSRRALTLLELTVTFIILAILGAIAVPLLAGAVNNTAASTAELSLYNLSEVAETLALREGLQIPTTADFATALAAAAPTSPSYVPDPSPTATNPLSVVLEGSTVATSPGQVAVDTGTSETGVAMATVGGGCVNELVTASKVVSFIPSDPSLPCSAVTALSGPDQ